MLVALINKYGVPIHGLLTQLIQSKVLWTASSFFSSPFILLLVFFFNSPTADYASNNKYNQKLTLRCVISSLLSMDKIEKHCCFKMWLSGYCKFMNQLYGELWQQVSDLSFPALAFLLNLSCTLLIILIKVILRRNLTIKIIFKLGKSSFDYIWSSHHW